MREDENSPYFENFRSVEDIISSYKAPENALEGATIYLAWYGYGSYSGRSLVIFEKDGNLYEVNASHCSCHGLEGEWASENTSWEALKMRTIYNDYDGAVETQEYLQKIVAEHLQ